MGMKKSARVDFTKVVPTSTILAGTAATGATTTDTYTNCGEHTFVVYNEGANTSRIQFRPVADANCTTGCEIPSTNTDNVGGMITPGHFETALSGSPYQFTVGTDAAFYTEMKLGIPDVTEYDGLFFGFVEPATYVAGIASAANLVAAYDEKAGFNINLGDIYLVTSLAGSDTATDTTDNWASDAVKTLKVMVSATGVVTYTINGAAPTTTAAFTFANATVVQPALIFMRAAADVDTPPIINYWAWGLQ